MKLNDMPYEQYATKMIEIAPCLDELARDEKLSAVLGDFRESTDGKKPSLSDVARVSGGLIPLLFQEHKDTVEKLISLSTGKPAAEVRKMRAGDALTAFRECLGNDLYPFFLLAVAMV